jgi:hypothetical protein
VIVVLVSWWWRGGIDSSSSMPASQPAKKSRSQLGTAQQANPSAGHKTTQDSNVIRTPDGGSTTNFGFRTRYDMKQGEADEKWGRHGLSGDNQTKTTNWGVAASCFGLLGDDNNQGVTTWTAEKQVKRRGVAWIPLRMGTTANSVWGTKTAYPTCGYVATFHGNDPTAVQQSNS